MFWVSAGQQHRSASGRAALTDTVPSELHSVLDTHRHSCIVSNGKAHLRHPLRLSLARQGEPRFLCYLLHHPVSAPNGGCNALRELDAVRSVPTPKLGSG